MAWWYPHHQKGGKIRRWPVALVVLLGAWWSVLPLLSSLHMAFSLHRHHFCEVHHRYEDLVVKYHSDDPNRQPATPETGISSRAYTVTLGDHLDCPLSNLLLYNHAIPEEKVSFSAAVGEYADPGGNHTVAIVPPSVLSRAPKHSPPC